MNLTELSDRLDKAIAQFESDAGAACVYCPDESFGDALHASHQATAKALSSFKADIMVYLSQL